VVVGAGMKYRKVGALPHDRTDLDPRLGFPREGERRRGNQDALLLPGTRRVVGASRARHVGRLQSAPRHAAPPGWEVALQSRSTRLFCRFVLRCLSLTRQASEPARRVSGREARASRPSTRRSAPEGFYDRFRCPPTGMHGLDVAISVTGKCSLIPRCRYYTAAD
jgi:hypothetical protein